MKSPFSLEDKKIWVVGAAGYLGQATVTLLQSCGAQVHAIDIENRAQDFIAALDDQSNLSAVSLNTRDTDRSAAFVADTIAGAGAPDGLIDLSYASTAKSFDDLTAEDFDTVNHGGLTSTFVLGRAVGNAMKERKSGSIVLFSSMYGSVSPKPSVYEAPMNVNPIEYGVGKAGIVQMTRYFAVHYGKHNVRCNCISPGPFPNPGVQKTHPEFIKRLTDRVPLGRVGRQEEIAGVATFLVSDASTYITGQNLFVDGGWTSW